MCAGMCPTSNVMYSRMVSLRELKPKNCTRVFTSSQASHASMRSKVCLQGQSWCQEPTTKKRQKWTCVKPITIDCIAHFISQKSCAILLSILYPVRAHSTKTVKDNQPQNWKHLCAQLAMYIPFQRCSTDGLPIFQQCG